MKIYRTVKSALLVNSTTATRFIFLLLNVGLLLEMLNSSLSTTPAHALLYTLTPDFIYPELLWPPLVLLYITQLGRGLGGQVGLLSWLLEGVLGKVLWLLIAASAIAVEGFPGLVSFQALIAVWLFIRYPTHWGKKRA